MQPQHKQASREPQPLSVTIKRRRQEGLRVHPNVLHTIFNRATFVGPDHGLKSGTLENWKRKFHEKQRSKDADAVRTVKGGRRVRRQDPNRDNIFRVQDGPRVLHRLLR